MEKRRPLPVTIISLVLIVTALIGLVYHLTDFMTAHPLQYEVVWITLVRFIAILSGAYMLRGYNWARWLSLAWIAFHVIIGILHSAVQAGLHVVILAIFAYFLFRPRANQYFAA